jgi:hypothetical protein
LTHTWSVRHVRPQPPQAKTLVRVLRHQGRPLSVHTELGEVQRIWDVQVPVTHTLPPVQKLPTRPQLLGLALRSVQPPVARPVKGGRQTQRPPEHICSLRQVLPIDPQLTGSMVTLTQLLLLSV